MMIGTVLGPLVLDRPVPEAAEKRFAQVRCGANLLTALDLVGAKKGDGVLVLTGEGAGRMCPELPVDAVILGIAANNG